MLKKEIEKCNHMLRNTKECSQERMGLVRRLGELRIKLAMAAEMKTLEHSDPAKETKVVCGHHLSLVWKHNWSKNKFCDVCTKIIWKYVHQLYECAGKIFLFYKKLLLTEI